MNVHRSFLRQESQKKVQTYKTAHVERLGTYDSIIRNYYDILLYMKRTASRIIHWKGENDRIDNVEVTNTLEDRCNRSSPVRTSFEYDVHSNKRSSIEKGRARIVPIATIG
jgi:hypothetical protein